MALRKYLLAAGNGTVGGMGALGIYLGPLLSRQHFEEAWMVQQRLTTLLHKDAHEARTDAAFYRAARMEEEGKLDEAYRTPRADGLPFDPYG